MTRCPNCGTQQRRPNAKFCQNCGYPLSPSSSAGRGPAYHIHRAPKSTSKLLPLLLFGLGVFLIFAGLALGPGREFFQSALSKPRSIARGKTPATTKRKNPTASLIPATPITSLPPTLTSTSQPSVTPFPSPTSTNYPTPTPRFSPTPRPSPTPTRGSVLGTPRPSPEEQIREVLWKYRDIKIESLTYWDTHRLDEVLAYPVLERQKRGICGLRNAKQYYQYGNREFHILDISFQDDQHATVLARIRENRVLRSKSGKIIKDYGHEDYRAVFLLEKDASGHWKIYCFQALDDNDPISCKVTIPKENPCNR